MKRWILSRYLKDEQVEKDQVNCIMKPINEHWLIMLKTKKEKAFKTTKKKKKSCCLLERKKTKNNGETLKNSPWTFGFNKFVFLLLFFFLSFLLFILVH